MKKFTLFFMSVFFSISFGSAYGQEDQDKNPWVYESEYQLPWSRVDSLTKLIELTDDIGFYEKAKELGYIVDFRVYIHHTGDIWNVKIQWLYSSWEGINASWKASEVYEAIGVDKEERKRINSGFDWVFKEVTHQDNIYRLIVGAE